MSELLAAIVAFPAVVPTVLLVVALLYWLLVLVGAADIDLLGGEGVADGALDGAGDGVAHALLPGVDGAAQGAVDGVADGAAQAALHGTAADGAAEGVADAAMDGSATHGTHAAPHALPNIHRADAALGLTAGERDPRGAVPVLSLSNLRSVPVTVAASALIAFTWLLTVLGGRLTAALTALVPSWLVGSLVLGAAALISLLPTAVVVRPMGRFFVVHSAKSHAELVGRVCRITTGSVGPKFGQAELQGEDLHLIVQVRHDTDSAFVRGDRALIVAWDSKREAFVVEPYDNVFGNDVRRS
ncbi:MAG: hypothetical protein MUF54_23515 [Polyangiaceae bacterium]|jgi:hypothetical protein|nr:hypothetical protein [Polyangiaceae bacterium]